MRKTAAGKPEGWLIPYLPGALVIIPPGPVRQRIGRLRRKYDSNPVGLVPVHITVTQPFRHQPTGEESDIVMRILVRFQPFKLRYGPLRTFLPYPCIWYEIQPAEKIIKLRRALHASGLFNTDLSHTRGFVPHMSITDGTPDSEDTERIYNRIRNRVRQGEFLVDSLVYTRPDWQMFFKTVKTIPLGRNE
ncbi:hypothetical protein CH330_01230 [candidate division WOR-3 bacterium JGI_Cruoil_03_51_56]|uniref:2'-5' RNA ligase n=1 Tax=candidate division WOR-3 bacterium JGI_Cruoil_03_51_56 TaxID=1973747 RepID=A0A235BXB9_UNCW3|nr:MAG: hypothetical protein CH330_01230 [candidate division WOR-3 bacterium JGI_Cruoil_03_51_56]